VHSNAFPVWRQPLESRSPIWNPLTVEGPFESAEWFWFPAGFVFMVSRALPNTQMYNHQSV
jgi:hypothetical protein